MSLRSTVKVVSLEWKKSACAVFIGFAGILLSYQEAFSGGGCQATVTCQGGVATCQGSAESQPSSDYFDSAVCSVKDNKKICHVNRRYDRGPNQGTNASISPTYICCQADGTAFATPHALTATQNCSSI
jgi:hypothetical protein